MSNLNESLKRIIERKPELEHFVRGLPNLGKPQNGSQYSKEVNKIYNAFSLYGNELYELENDRIKGRSSRSLGGGSPMRTEAFPLCKEEVLKFILEDQLSDYPMAAGDEYSRKIISEYLEKEGFQKNGNRISEDNIIFTVSTTQAFNIIMQIIARPYDVVLMTGPNYGLFTFVPERAAGARVEILPLSAEDDWYVNPVKLSNRIDEINEQNETGYQIEDVHFEFTHEVMSNEQENKQNDLTDAQRKQTEINTLLNIANVLDQETIVQAICEILDIDYEDIKDKLPDDEATKTGQVQRQLDDVAVTDGEGGGEGEQGAEAGSASTA